MMVSVLIYRVKLQQKKTSASIDPQIIKNKIKHAITLKKNNTGKIKIIQAD